MPVKKKKESCTARSKEFLEKQGYIVANTEKDQRLPKKNPVTGQVTWIVFKQDLFGFGDLIAFHPDKPGCLIVQTTTRDNQASRITKILGIPEHRIIMAAGNQIHVHGWAKVGPRGKAKTWQVTVTDMADRSTPAEVVAVGGPKGLFDKDDDW